MIELCTFINLKNDEDRLLFLVFTVAAFIPDFPHPILVLFGSQGSGKTTPQKLLKKLIDPSVLNALSSPDGLKEFIQLASHHYFVFLDNVSSLPIWLSDSLAKAVTGDGFSKRELFSDDDDIIYSFQRTVALNGIGLVVRRADLLERSILLELERISKEKRREEKEFWEAFDEKRPYFLGAIFETVSIALEEYPRIQLPQLPRMADFTKWGCAIAKALGYTQEQFLTAYYKNISRQNDEAIEADPVAKVIVSLIEDRILWEGTATELYEELREHVERLKIDTRSKDWPKDPSSLSRKLHIVQTNLAEVGIKIIKDEKVRPKRIIIEKLQQNPDNANTSTETENNESATELSGLENHYENHDINADTMVQPLIDGMTGLSAFSAPNTSIPEELLTTTNNPHWKQYFPKKSLSLYSNGQLDAALNVLNDYPDQMTVFFGSKPLYRSFLQNLQAEQSKRHESPN